MVALENIERTPRQSAPSSASAVRQSSTICPPSSLSIATSTLSCISTVSIS
jgi:hypothetical protein